MQQSELLSCQDVMRLTGIRSRTTIWRRINKGTFPNPVEIGFGQIRWRKDEIENWINDLPVRTYQ